MNFELNHCNHIPEIYNLFFEFAYNMTPKKANDTIEERLRKSFMLCVPRAWKRFIDYDSGRVFWNNLLDFENPNLILKCKVWDTLNSINWKEMRTNYFDDFSRLAVYHTKATCFRSLSAHKELRYGPKVKEVVSGVLKLIHSHYLVLNQRYARDINFIKNYIITSHNDSFFRNIVSIEATAEQITLDSDLVSLP